MGERPSEIGRSLIGVALVALLIWGAEKAYFYRREMLIAALLAMGALAEVWQYWIGPLILIVWIWMYRGNRRRQEIIIELLEDIRRKLD